uniref:Saposin B-type domain-containing protein n=1 Tax=Trichobilharzia regenti TaxID=157069 RepID=A0AA85IZE3_TRIRE|nr:unnamed protein product [Trichobilharzia regenti]
MRHVWIILLPFCLVFCGVVFGGGNNPKGCSELKEEMKALLNKAIKFSSHLPHSTECVKVAAKKILYSINREEEKKKLPGCKNVRTLMNLSNVAELSKFSGSCRGNFFRQE